MSSDNSPFTYIPAGFRQFTSTTSNPDPPTRIIRIDVRHLAFWSGFENAARYLDTQILSRSVALEAFKVALQHSHQSYQRRNIIFNVDMEGYLDAFYNIVIKKYIIWSTSPGECIYPPPDGEMLNTVQCDIHDDIRNAYGNTYSMYFSAAYVIGVDMELFGLEPKYCARDTTRAAR
ncbi:hypothetical protein PMZ80_002237 [Knufia obscura]|uniref:Uncharacterized protein n=2 Tax=Knufia TaxID=430999 RepID=A0AAN8I248_9EURO|nr:hypothetical protein PMZ80_002237 [Knufia obscura]KAK5950597.1 hypothetical protein OHC33_008263 [Knufia fluminis]